MNENYVKVYKLKVLRESLEDLIRLQTYFVGINSNSSERIHEAIMKVINLIEDIK